MRLILINIIGLCISINSVCQDSTYMNEEYSALNDIFVDLVGTSYYNHNHLWPSYPVEDLLDFYNDSISNEVLEYLFPSIYYEPYDFANRFIDTEGDSMSIVNLVKDYSCFRDSVFNQPDLRNLIIYVNDSLNQINRYDLKRVDIISKFFKYKTADSHFMDTLTTRFFDFNMLSSKGRYMFSDDRIPDFDRRAATKEIKELFALNISRVIFNSDFTKGAIFYDYWVTDADGSWRLVLIKKKKGKWRIKEKIITMIM